MIQIVTFKDADGNSIRQGNIGPNKMEDYIGTFIDDMVVASVELADVEVNKSEMQKLQEQIDALKLRVDTLEGR